jgi:hypothetical protein
MLLFQSKSQSKSSKAASSLDRKQLNDVSRMDSSSHNDISTSESQRLLCLPSSVLPSVSWTERYKPKNLEELKIHYAKKKLLREWFNVQFPEMYGK